MELSSESVVLRPPVDGDGATVAASVQASLPELTPWMPWASANYDVAAALAWIRGETGDQHRFLIIDRSDTIVGSCGMKLIDEPNRVANLGYWVRSDRAGQGMATQATKLLANYGHRVGQLHRIEVAMSVHNEPSRRVAEKSGAFYEGVRRGALLLHGDYHDAHVWSFLPDESTQ